MSAHVAQPTTRSWKKRKVIRGTPRADRGIRVPGRTQPEVIERLVLLGWDEAEARCYVELVRVGESSAAVVARELDLTPVEAARILDHLVALGHATRSNAKPPLYRGTPPKQMLDGMRDAQQRRLDVLGKLRPALLEELEKPGAALAATHAVRILHGRRDLLAASSDLGASCTTSLLSVNCTNYTVRSNEAMSILDTMAALVRRGVALRTIVWDTPEVREALRGLRIPPGVHIRLLESPVPVRFSVYDGKALLASVQTDPDLSLDAKHDVSLVSYAPEMIHRHELLFEHLWLRAKPVEPSSTP